MTTARKDQISLEATPFYHCYVRCVRRAFLCGVDSQTGENFDHRKQWIVSRIRFLSYVYAIDICAYAVMSNHYHVVLHVDKERAQSWSQEEVAERWMQLYKGSLLVDRWLANPNSIDIATKEKVFEIIEQWRERLYSIEWFMRSVNEKIARMANEEENCKGRFWEGRYKSQALLDEAALLSCMTYVDLNPVRAAMEDSLQTSDFTSIQQRLFDYAKQNGKQDKPLHKNVAKQEQIKKELNLTDIPQAPLQPFGGSAHTPIHQALPFTQQDYFALVESTGKILRSDKRGVISPSQQSLLQTFDIDPDRWIDHIQKFGRTYAHAVGSVTSLQAHAERKRAKWLKGVGCADFTAIVS